MPVYRLMTLICYSGCCTVKRHEHRLRRILALYKLPLLLLLLMFISFHWILDHWSITLVKSKFIMYCVLFFYLVYSYIQLHMPLYVSQQHTYNTGSNTHRIRIKIIVHMTMTSKIHVLASITQLTLFTNFQIHFTMIYWLNII